jgi:hypothetical protein
VPLDLPLSAQLAWWGTAWLRGYVVSDLVLDAVLGDDATHVVAGLPDVDGSAPLSRALAELRIGGARSFGLALPVAGDPVGIGGPRGFSTAALETGEAVVAGETGLVPRRVGGAVEWTAYPASPRQLTDVGEADRGLRLSLRDAASALAELDVARWRPEVADELMALRSPVDLPLPEATPPRAVRLASLATRCRAIVGLALEDDGGSITAAEADARRSALLPLDRAARRGLVAACSASVWPPL